MGNNPAKTNAARLLDAARIPYRLIPYAVDENHLEAQHVADELGEDINTVYKTLVLRGDRHGLMVCVIPGNREIDLKKAARASGNKKVEMIAMRELLPTTGYIRGGCSPIGMKKALPTYMQEDALALDEFFISAGVRGLHIAVSPSALAEYTGATVCDVATEST